jgi:hypothetical protein
VTQIHWQNGHAYGVCADCHKIVRLNKPVLGGLHICLTVCEKRGQHAQVLKVKRVGPFWARRDEQSCPDCGSVIS